MVIIKHFAIFLIFENIQFVTGQTGTNLQDLLTNLFTTNNYNIYARPSADQSIATMISIDFYMSGITSLDEIAEKFTTTGYMSVSWTDDYLTWTPASYGGIQDFYYPQGNIWKPDLALQNGFNQMQELGSSFLIVNVNSAGKVTWEPFELFETKCSVDTTFFPFDKQICNLIFICWGYSPSHVNLTVGTAGIQLFEDFTSNGEWSVDAMSYSLDYGVNDARVIFSVTIKRKSSYFVLNICMPILLLSFLNSFTFFLPCSGGERNGFAVTVWLSFAVFLIIVQGSLPKSSSSTPIITVYLLLQILLGSLVVIISTVETRVVEYTTEDMDIPKALIKIVLFVRAFKRKKCSKTNVESLDEEHEKRPKRETNADGVSKSPVCWKDSSISWKDVVSAVDYISFWICLIFIILTTLMCYCYMAAS